MKRSLRFLLLACAGFVGLAFAAPALAAYSPSLTIEQTSYKLGAATTVDTFIFAPQNNDPTAKLKIFAPSGYGANVSQAAGTKIGRVVALVKAKKLAGAILPLAGDVVVGNPSDAAIVAASQQCTQSPVNQAVWILNANLVAGGQSTKISIPVFVNKVGPLTTLQICLQSPDVDPSVGGAPFGAQLVSADFTAKGIFTNASARAGYEWAAVFTPYTPGTPTPNAAGTNEWRTYVGLPSSLTLARATSKTGVKFAGRLSVAGLNPAGIRLRLYYGRKSGPAPNAVSLGDSKAKIARTAKLPRTGKYGITRPAVKVRTFFQMRFENYITNCTGASPSGLPVPCRGEDLAPMTSNQVGVLPRKR